MKILIINGSPKGANSITLQTCLWLEKQYPEHRFTVLHAGQRIKALERDFAPAREAVEQADLLLFSYPVYTFLAPSQLHRFIELLKQENLDLSGKYAAQISTSKHFYDITARDYIRDNCLDLGLRYLTALCADMDDLTTETGRREAREFFDRVCRQAEAGLWERPMPRAPHVPVIATLPEPVEQAPGDVVIVTDCGPEDASLRAMIDRFRAVLPRARREVNIRDYPFQGGCLGCFHCAVDGKCIYTDGFDRFLREQIQTGEAIVYAFTVRDHSPGPRFKLYTDRQFCNGHRTVTMGMPMGWLISGPYSREHNLQNLVEGRTAVGGNVNAGVATDECDTDRAVDLLAHRLTVALEQRHLPDRNFYGVGGMKIFRDLIWLMQGMMRADHKFYKAHGQYDFPQKKWPRMLAMYGVGAMLASPRIKAAMGNKMNEGMLMPYKKVLEQADKEKKS